MLLLIKTLSFLIVISSHLSLTAEAIFINETCSCDNVKRPYNLNCNKYYECENGELYLKDCETGKTFDQNAQTCLFNTKSNCEPDPSFEADGWIGSNCHFDNDKLKTFEWNCNKYFQCAPGGLGLNLRDCQKGLYFDETKQRCDWLSTTSCHPEEPCIATTPSPPTVITTPSPDEVCSKKCNGGYPDPGSCTPDIDTRPYGICSGRFYRCTKGYNTLCWCPQECNYDLIYRDQEYGCDLPCHNEDCNVECQPAASNGISDFDLRQQTDVLKDPSEFNKPNCLYHEDGNCPDNLLSKNQACPSKFVKCYKGWQCEYVCKNSTEVYNYKSNNCQEQFACQKSMRDDL